MNIDIHIGESYRYQLRQALLIYGGNGGHRGDNAFVTLHDVQGQDTPTLGPAQPLSSNFLTALSRNLQRNAGVEILPENVLARTHEMFAWWTPAQARPMFFGSPDGKMAALNGRSFPQPALVFVVVGHSLSVRALKTSQRPSANTKLYVAPYWNVYEGGNICLGSAPIPTSPSISAIPQWERCFFESEFTHPNGAQRITTHKGGFAGLWEALAGKDLCDRARRLVSSRKVADEQEEKRYRTVIGILLRLLFFVYTVAPTVNASYRMALGIVLLMRFARRKLPHESPAIEQLVYSESIACLRAQAQHKSGAFSRFVSLESINLLLVIRELGETYRVPAHLTEKLFALGEGSDGFAEWCYFDIVSCIFYIQHHPEYASLRKAVDDEVDRRLSDLTDVERSAEKAYLFLDMLTCPYVADARKRVWIDGFRSQFSLLPYSAVEVQEFLGASLQSPWFINWEGVDILTMLQKKEFVRVY